MDPLRAGAVFVSKSVLSDPRAGPRAERLASLIAAPKKEVVDDAELLRLQRDVPWERLPRRGREEIGFDARVVFIDAMHWSRGDAVAPKYSWAQLRSAHKEWNQYGVVCQSALEIQTILGCGFDCAYCPYTLALTITCDLEQFVERVERLFVERPHQELYKLNNRSDTLIFEPEYGLAKLLVERFARADRQTLMLYSKSANVEHLKGLEHGKRTVACFTLSTPTTARLLERAAPSFEARLEAAAQCEQAGYPVRFRFSPIVPFKGWRQEIVEVVRRMAQRVRPELVTLWTLSMVSLEELGRVVDLDALDPASLEAARQASLNGGMKKGAPFPEEHRAEIYAVVADAISTYCPDTRLSLCLETPPVLEALHPKLAIVDGQQVCNCGPRCTSERVAIAAPASVTSPRPSLRMPGHRIGSPEDEA